MIYKNIDRDLLEFVDNPIKNIGYLKNKSTSLRLWVRLLYSIPFFRRYISTNEAKLIFYNLYIDFLKGTSSIVEELKPLKYAENNIVEYVDDALKILTSYFRIEINNLLENEKEMASGFIYIHLISKLGYHCNRISESLNLSEEYSYSIVSAEKLFISYFLSEIYLFLESDLFNIKLINKNVIIQLNREGEKRLKGYWLSEFLEENTKFSDTDIFREVSTYLTKSNSINSTLINALTDNILDKMFSISHRYLPQHISNNEKYKCLREVVYFSALLECCKIKGINSINRAFFQNDRNISNNSLALIDTIVEFNPDNKIGGLGGFIYKDSKNNYCRGVLAFKYGVRKFAGILIDKKQKQLKGRDFKGDIGSSFEVTYLLKHLEEFKGYKVYKGFKSGNKSKIQGYDIDLVLVDIKHNDYYFIQVKYRFSALPTYFSEQYKFFNEGAFKKGCDQLLAFKKNLNHESIRQTLDNNDLGGANKNNSHFILLHNIPFLNFYEYKGIYFYEWNLFRNILHGGKIYWHHNNEVGESTPANILKLHKPNEIIDAYFNISINDEKLKKQFDLFKKAKCKFSFGKGNVECKML